MPITLADPAAYGLDPVACAEVPELRSAWAKVFMDRAARQRVVILTRGHHFVDDDGTLAPEALAWADGPAASLVADRGLYAAVVTNAGLAVLERATRSGIRWLTPSRPLAQVGGRAARLTGWQGLDWTWQLRQGGLKLLSDPVPARGVRDYVFPYQLVGGYAAPVEQPDGTLAWGGFTLPRAFVIGADTLRYPCGRWQSLPGSRVGFRFDDAVLPAAAFPYRVDPTSTFTVAATGDDGYAQAGFGGSWPPTPFGSVDTAGGDMICQRYKSGAVYLIRVSLARWDTSSLSGQTLTSGSAKLYANYTDNTDNWSLAMGYISSALWPIDTTDATDPPLTDAHTGTAYASITTPAYNTFALTNADANFNKSGYTALQINMADFGTPTGANSIQINAYDASTNKPQLLAVTTDYSDPGVAPHRRFFVFLGR